MPALPAPPPPPQSQLAKLVNRLRQAAAAQADARVRLTGEVMSGALAMKMLGWEGPFTKAICDIRHEARGRGRVGLEGVV